MQSYHVYRFFNIFLYIAFALLIMYLPRLRYYIDGFRKQKRLYNPEKKRLVVVIPARDECTEIVPLLESLNSQTYPADYFDVYVVVKSLDDPTCDLIEMYSNMYVIEVKNQTCKGSALDGAIKIILARDKSYDAYVIVDADNIVKDSFLEEMNNGMVTDCQIVLGKREIKNWLYGDKSLRTWVTNCNALTYFFLDALGNTYRSNHGIPCTLCGTGILVRSDVIRQNNGWPYHSLTEDFEMTADATLKGWSMTYYSYAVTYTEEVLSLKAANQRRKRWVLGYAQVISAYRKKIRKDTFSALLGNGSFIARIRGIKWKNFDFLYSLVPYCIFIIESVVFFLFFLFLGFFDTTAFLFAAAVLGILYGTLLFYSCIGLLVDRKAIKITVREKIVTALINPLYVSEYGLFYAAAFLRLKKGVVDTEWIPVERIVNKHMKEK